MARSVIYKLYVPRFIADDEGKPSKIYPEGNKEIHDRLLKFCSGFTTYDFCTGNWKYKDQPIIERVEVIEIIAEDTEDLYWGMVDVCCLIKQLFNQKSVLMTKQYGVETS